LINLRQRNASCLGKLSQRENLLASSNQFHVTETTVNAQHWDAPRVSPVPIERYSVIRPGGHFSE
jgi:hypothetical protein